MEFQCEVLADELADLEDLEIFADILARLPRVFHCFWRGENCRRLKRSQIDALIEIEDSLIEMRFLMMKLEDFFHQKVDVSHHEINSGQF